MYVCMYVCMYEGHESEGEEDERQPLLSDTTAADREHVRF